jgi:ABC-type phosphate/phosphonate transport system permease subunit
MRLLRTLCVFIAATLLAALGQKVLGIAGMVLGSIVGIFVGYWAARRLMP